MHNVSFRYTDDKPQDWAQIEEKLKEAYKGVFEQFPTDFTTFNFKGGQCWIETTIDLANFHLHNAQDNDNK